MDSILLEDLHELALDLRWTWNHHADRLWNAIDAELWRTSGSAWSVLRASAGRLAELSRDPVFVREVQEQCDAHRRYLAQETWFSGTGRDVGTIAYFSMEFGLSEALPFYAGGLGMLAGDYLKTASDLGVPVVGVGMLYRQGYFQQRFEGDQQQESYPSIDPDDLPLRPLRNDDGSARTVSIDLPGRTLRLAIWEAIVGRVRLYLVDSMHPANTPADREVTARLYVDDPQLRLEQEMALGIGGMRALELLGCTPEIVHLNEGHAAFAVLERARMFMARTGQPFAVAMRCVRAGTIFTTHTAVAAAFDRFPAALIEDHFGAYAADLGLALPALLELGRSTPEEVSFTMPVLAMHGAGIANAVSRLHADVSRQLFAPLFAHWPLAEIPVVNVTNGVHMSTWDSPAADAFWTEHAGSDRWLKPLDVLAERMALASDEALWALRRTQRGRLTERLRRFDPDVLVIGFARRFTDYKRGALLLTDPDRLARLLNDPAHPVQLVVAGKAHPSDANGKRSLARWHSFVSRPDVRERAAFLPNYDLAVAMTILEGADVWLNMPRRTWEACGTSGMKVLVNGGLNCSTLDGWWDEAYEPSRGWAIGDRSDAGALRDAFDAESLYQLLENEIVPEFYEREAGIPTQWIARVRASMAHLTPRYSSNRMMLDYFDLYRRAGPAYRARTAADGQLGVELEATFAGVRARWGGMSFVEVIPVPQPGGLTVTARIALGGMHTDEIAVELYADPEDPRDPLERHPLHLSDAAPAGSNTQTYSGAISTHRAAGDYTVRIIPRIAQALIPMEFAPICWSH